MIWRYVRNEIRTYFRRIRNIKDCCKIWTDAFTSFIIVRLGLKFIFNEIRHNVIVNKLEKLEILFIM